MHLKTEKSSNYSGRVCPSCGAEGGHTGDCGRRFNFDPELPAQNLASKLPSTEDILGPSAKIETTWCTFKKTCSLAGDGCRKSQSFACPEYQDLSRLMESGRPYKNGKCICCGWKEGNGHGPNCSQRGVRISK